MVACVCQSEAWVVSEGRQVSQHQSRSATSYHLHQLLGLQETLLKPDLLGFGLGAGSGDPAEQQLGMFMGNIYARNKKVSRSQRYHVFKANRATLRQLLSCFQSCRSSVLALIFSKQLFGAP